jgi:hypothetical protein
MLQDNPAHVHCISIDEWYKCERCEEWGAVYGTFYETNGSISTNPMTPCEATCRPSWGGAYMDLIRLDGVKVWATGCTFTVTFVGSRWHYSYCETGGCGEVSTEWSISASNYWCGEVPISATCDITASINFGAQEGWCPGSAGTPQYTPCWNLTAVWNIEWLSCKAMQDYLGNCYYSYSNHGHFSVSATAIAKAMCVNRDSCDSVWERSWGGTIPIQVYEENVSCYPNWGSSSYTANARSNFYYPRLCNCPPEDS